MTLDNLLGRTFPVIPPTLTSLCLWVVAAVFLIKSTQQRNRYLKLTAAAFCVTCGLLPGQIPNSRSLVVTFLPVGQGDSAVIEIPPGRIIVVDGGGNHDDTFNPGERILTPFLKRRRVEVIDAIVLSHPDADHLMGLLPVLENFEVKELWHSGFDASHPLMAQLIEVAQKRHTQLRSMSELPHGVKFGEATLDFLSPMNEEVELSTIQSTNNRSLVFRVSYGGHSILFPGDIEEVREIELLSREELRSTIVKAPHHGSKSSSSDAFVAATGARHVVFCTGVNNRFGFPHSQVIKRWQDSGASLWNTAKNGETTFRLSGETVEVAPFIATSEDKS